MAQKFIVENLIALHTPRFTVRYCFFLVGPNHYLITWSRESFLRI